MQRLFIIFSYAAMPLIGFGAQCVIDPLVRYTQLGGDAADKRVHVEANLSESDFATAVFSGAVKVRQGDVHIIAPKLDYIRNDAMITGNDDMIVGMPQAAIKASQGRYLFQQDKAIFQNAEYYLAPKEQTVRLAQNPGANGYAQHAEFNRQTKIDSLKHITWTTCERQSPLWQIQANQLILNHQTNRGIAYDMTFRIKNIPIVYLPYFSFPLTSERATGFLTPSANSSEERGVEVNVPFYWNIAPNQDATFTLNPMSKRGLMTQAQWRYLNKNQHILAEAAFLPSDRAYDDKNRWRINVEHQYQLNPAWQTDIRYQDVSDIDYVDDMDSGLNLYNDWYIERHARATGQGNWGNMLVQIQDYQRISPEVDDTTTPYARFPQIRYNKNWRYNGINLGFNTEAVRFYKHHTGSATRLLFNGEMAYRLSSSYGFIEPKLSYTLRYYQLKPKNHAFQNGHKIIGLPTFSVDSGLIFERNYTFSGENYTQTLEPRLFYLYTPYQKQSDIPLFDTSDLSKSWSWLFARNRFSGSDRIGDANQLTTAVTTKFYRQDDGQEKAKFSIGQIQYFKDRKVGLHQGISSDSKSIIVSEGQYYIDRHWSVYGLNFWNPNQNQNQRNVLDIRYKLDNDRYISFGHRYNRDNYDQLSLGGGWRFNTDWRIFARQDYSLRYNHGINTMLGIEYNDCCWAWRLVGRRYRNEAKDRKAHNSIYLEFIFKGLGNMGSSSGTLLKNQLSNFQPLPQEKNL